MTDNTNDGASAPAAQPAALKSTDTSVISAIKVKEGPADPAPAKPVERVAPQQEPEGEAGDAVENEDAPAADAATEKKKDRLPRWVQERLERVRRVTEAETRERTLRELQERQQPHVREPANVEPTEREKTLEDFDFDSAAYLDYKVERGIERRERQAQLRAEQQKQVEAVEQFKAKIDSFEERVGAGAWEDINTSPINTDPAFKPLVDLFLGDENDLAIAHHLAMNPDEASRLLALSPLARVREVAKLADQFGEQPHKPAPAPLPKKVTNAPPPPKTVTGGGKATPSEDDDSLSPDQRIALWRARQGKR